MKTKIALALAAGLAMSTSAMAAGSDVASATVINMPTSGTVVGTVSTGTPGDFTEILSGNYTVDVDGIFSHTLGSGDHGLAAGADFTLYTGEGYDSELRITDGAGTTLAQNDDGGPFGANPNYGSQVEGTVNADGSINFDITHWQDNDFEGASTAGGSTWHLGAVSGGTPGVTGQFWRFTGLNAGDLMTFSTDNTGLVDGVTDTVMTAYDSAGNLLAHNDDAAGGGLFSAMDVIAGADGEIIIAVSEYHGLFNNPAQADVAYHLDGGDADGTFNLNYNYVPAPGSFALVGLGGLVVARRRR